MSELKMCFVYNVINMYLKIDYLQLFTLITYTLKTLIYLFCCKTIFKLNVHVPALEAIEPFIVIVVGVVMRPIE